MVEKKRKDRILWATAIIAFLVLGSLSIWFKLERSFGFVSKFEGQVISYPFKYDYVDPKMRDAEAKQLVCYGFKGDPDVIRNAIRDELQTKNWTYGEGMDIFMRADFQMSKHGIPTQEFSNMSDYAVFERDKEVLDVPAGVTCVFAIRRRSNLSEMYYRFKHRKESEEENP